MKKPQEMAIEDLMKMLDGMEIDQMRPKKEEPKLELEMEQKPEIEVAGIDPEKADLFKQGFDSQTLKPQDKQIKIEKKKIKVGAMEPEQLDDEQRKLLEELYSKIG